jgi:tetratricopeptide (TPR) repeat protein
MVVTSAVQLWVKYGVEDFQAVKPEIVANLVDRLMEGVPKGMVPALEAAAAVRWFDQPILRAVMAQEDVRDAYNELRRFPFVRTRAEGLALHDAVREIMDENLRVQDAERHCELHERAAAYFEKRLEKATGEEAERLGLERLYHRIRADEETGIQLFQEMAEELARYRLVNRLRALLNDVNTYPLERENSRLWREYYNARRMQLDRYVDEAETAYSQLIAKTARVDAWLHRKALFSLLNTLTRVERTFQPNGIVRALEVCVECERLLTKTDPDWVLLLIERGRIYLRQIDSFARAEKDLRTAIALCSQYNDIYGLVTAYGELKAGYIDWGAWKNVLEIEKEMLNNLPPEVSPFLRARALANWKSAWVFMGRYKDTEQDLWEVYEIERHLGRKEKEGEDIPRDLLVAIGMQKRCSEVNHHFATAVKFYEPLGRPFNAWLGWNLGFWGMTEFQCGDFENARTHFHSALKASEEGSLDQDMCWTYWLGMCYSVVEEWKNVEKYFTECLNLGGSKRVFKGRNYFQCGALTGLIRVKHAQGDYAAIPPLLAEAEGLAQQYEYNDHLASLRLTQGHLAWEGVGQVSNLSYGFDAALRYYQHALIYALRYNRFLLDEVLSGRPQGTPLRPIIPECLKRGEEGRRMLIALRDWWQTGLNDIGTPRPDTISPIPENIPLLEAERIAREREPGDGSPQKSVVEQIESVL